MYHVVADGHLSPARFTWQLRFLRRHFEPVALAELVRRMSERALTGREIALTFDDGVLNHYHVVWPLLRDHAVPATFFVCSDLIGSGNWIWRTELRQRLRALTATARTRAAQEAGCNVTTPNAIMEWTKSLSAPECRAFRDSVTALTPAFKPSPEQAALHAPLTWEQLRQMDPRVVTIASHTRSHPLLTMLSDAQLQDEIVGSKHALENGLDRGVEFFCYPNGITTPQSIALARKHYSASVTIRSDFVHAEEDPAQLPRIPADGSRATFVRRLHRPTA
jgi:peptidoglycan/xylan/chitin deacetylase (PgdA/CDA1 family)